MKQVLSFLIVLIFFASCGQSQEEINKRNASIADSIKLEAQKELLTKQTAEKDSIAGVEKKQQQEVRREGDKNRISYELDNAEASLEGAKQKLEDIKQYQIGRSKDVKEEQVKNQVLVIKNWEHSIEDLKALLDKIKSGADYQMNMNADSVSSE